MGGYRPVERFTLADTCEKRRDESRRGRQECLRHVGPDGVAESHLERRLRPRARVFIPFGGGQRHEDRHEREVGGLIQLALNPNMREIAQTQEVEVCQNAR